MLYVKLALGWQVGVHGYVLHYALRHQPGIAPGKFVANPDHLEKLKQGVEAWNEWRTTDPNLRPDLCGADLRDVDLKYIHLDHANLKRANLQKAKLSAAHLRGANLREADLTGASVGQCQFQKASLESAKLDGANLALSDLSGANLKKASLRGVNLTVTELSQANLRETDLQGANLKMQRGAVRPEQLAGADLTGATLPDALNDLFKELKAVNDISESARKLFIAMLVACLYSWLTIATTTDVNLITNRASSPLPIIQTSVPIVGFYVVAPLLLLCVYFYFHFYLQKLWEELGSLPAIFPDGRRLHERSDPWLLNDLVRSHVAKLKSGRPFMSYFQQFISLVLAWWLVPATLFLFWGRYLTRHDFQWTTLQVVLLAVSITAASFLYRLAAATLRGGQRMPFSWWRDQLKSPRLYGGLVVFVGLAALFTLISAGAIRGVPPGRHPWWRDGPSGRWGWVPRAMAFVGYSPFANFPGADVSLKPPGWTGKSTSEVDLVKGADLSRQNQTLEPNGLRKPATDLRYVEAFGAFLAKANLSGAYLEGGDLVRSDLRGAFLPEADLTQANFIQAEMTGADLSGAKLTQAELAGANLSYADLSLADLSGADLSFSNLSNAELRGASLTGAILFSADVTFADFRSAAGLTGGTLNVFKTALHTDKAYYNEDLLQQLGLPPDHNKKLGEEQKQEERQKGQPAGSVAPPTGKPKGNSLR